MNYETRVNTVDTDGDVIVEDIIVEDAPAPPRRRWPWFVLAALLLGAIVAFFMLSGGEEEVPFGAAADEGQTQSVTVISPGAASLEGAINATGTLAARREMPVGVVGEGGRVVSVPVEAGDWVRQGQVLAVIDRSVQNQQAASQRAQIDVAQADADLAQANLDRALQLVERGFISQADIDRLTATRDAANARVQVARAQLGERQARNAQLNIVAPAAGLVLARNVEPGQVVTPGSGTLFSIARGGEMELLAAVGENELAQISTGAIVEVTPAGGDQSFSGQVWQVSPIIDETNRQGTVRVALSYAEGLRPGGFATATIASGSVVAPRLPESAILSDDDGSYVFIVDGDNKVVRRNVTVGAISDEGIAIASGLTGRERVVLRAGGFLREGETVRPVAGQ
ncbi:efflux RND transporter periplasmic adaptor subunit [Erythrobacter arachoides]|uniref:Efflux RND transporter periplasmic adaptor subunit n=1 Tax=Aurantiacibacter arachoides TaxID=1850444 RepID=A0A845A4Y8_9SPHN|nr:efflux RND transporter periplasmic adaptor subunit [Aurantiacibacter arachoides]MXO94704.1 efflux RND transporter periplasmic adaptor subunit [Aurantiacibacter arachoides]GGD61311.1 hemolysin secretion protein D [Aurantiacibacter arachoides]